MDDPAYATALLDWLACALGGWDQPAVRAARGTGDQTLALATAGHVLDYDDTYLPGLAHLSAPTAPVALALAAEQGAALATALDAYAAGFEAMGAMARACHPALYDGGWHPTAVCGSVGAAVTASRLLALGRDAEQTAVAIALLQAGGLRAAFGSDGKALQVALAAASGLAAARLAAGGASVPLERAARHAAGFDAAFGAAFAEPAGELAVAQNWIKAWPCCLQTHGAIEAAESARADGLDPDAEVRVAVHPISLKAAAYGPEVADGLQAKFSIPYCTALTLRGGGPGRAGFAAVDPAVVAGARRISVQADAELAGVRSGAQRRRRPVARPGRARIARAAAGSGRTPGQASRSGRRAPGGNA